MNSVTFATAKVNIIANIIIVMSLNFKQGNFHIFLIHHFANKILLTTSN